MRATFVLLFLWLPVISAFCQTEEDLKWEKTFEIRAGYGASSSYSWVEDNWCFCCDYDYEPPKIDFHEKKPLGHKYTTGALWVGAAVNLSRFWDVGATLNYAGFWQDFVEGRETSHYIGMQAMGRVNYINTKIVRLYSSLSLGGYTVIEKNHVDYYGDGSDFTLSCQITCIGVSVGKTLFGFTEIGVGPRGVITGGIGYRF